MGIYRAPITGSRLVIQAADKRSCINTCAADAYPGCMVCEEALYEEPGPKPGFFLVVELSKRASAPLIYLVLRPNWSQIANFGHFPTVSGLNLNFQTTSKTCSNSNP